MSIVFTHLHPNVSSSIHIVLPHVNHPSLSFSLVSLFFLDCIDNLANSLLPSSPTDEPGSCLEKTTLRKPDDIPPHIVPDILSQPSQNIEKRERRGKKKP